MHTEVDVNNPGRTIVEGMYAEVKLTLAKKDDALAVPIQAVSREGSHTTVLVVNLNDQIEEREVHWGSREQIRLKSLLASSQTIVW